MTLDQGEATTAWAALPAGTRHGVEQVTGTITRASCIPRKRGPGAGFVLEGRDGNEFFLKVVRKDSPAYPRLNRELLVNAEMPRMLPAPKMITPVWEGEYAGVLFEYLPGKDTDLSPGSPDIEPALGTVIDIARTCAWSGLPPVTEDVPVLREKEPLASGLPALDRVMFTAALSRFDPDSLAGERAVHYGLSPENLRITSNDEVFALDWESAVSGALWIDPLMMVMLLVIFGHDPADADKIVSRLSFYQSAPSDGVNGLVALLSLTCLHASRTGPEGNREVRARAFEAGRILLQHRMS